MMRWPLILPLVFIIQSFAASMPEDTAKALMDKRFGRLPLVFIENRQPLDHEGYFYAIGLRANLYLSSAGVTFLFKNGKADQIARWTVKLDFMGTGCPGKPEGKEKREGVFNYFKGRPEQWKTGIPVYSKVIYPALWPGIDLVFSGTVDRLKYHYIVKPGADPGRIRHRYRGATAVTLTDSGGLKVSTPAGAFQDEKPYAFQVINGTPVEVAMAFDLEEGGRKGHVTYGFDLGAYDSSLPLMLDPAFVMYSGFIGGIEKDSITGIAVDKKGNAYVTGATSSDESTFPVVTGPDLTYNDGGSTLTHDAFVAKISADGGTLEYCGYIGGEASDYGYGITIDSLGCAYVTGDTFSDEASFPVLIGPDLTYNGSRDAFVAKLSGDGTQLVYCGYLGGDGTDWANDIAVDRRGKAYLTGLTRSNETGFPVKAGPDLTYNGGFWGDAFVARVLSDGSGLDYCGYIGGSDDQGDVGVGIAVDDFGNAYVAGGTYSDESSFPVLVGPDLTYNGGLGDAFVAKVHATGTHLDYCGYLGGEDMDSGSGIAVDHAGNAYITGSTRSPEASFPVLVGPDLTHNGDMDVFIARVKASGVDLDYCGFIGGDQEDHGYDIDIDPAGNGYVTGYTVSTEATFPTLIGPYLKHKGVKDAFVARVNLSGAWLDYCGYLGGSTNDWGNGIAVDDRGNAYVGGVAGDPSFPTRSGPDISFNGGEYDAFVTKVSSVSLSSDAYELPESIGGILTFTLFAGLSNANRDHVLLGSFSGTQPGINLPGGIVTLPLNYDLFMITIVNLMNNSVFVDFMGSLDLGGCAVAKLDTNGPLPPGMAGLTLYFAYAVYEPWDFVSHPVAILVVP